MVAASASRLYSETQSDTTTFSDRQSPAYDEGLLMNIWVRKKLDKKIMTDLTYIYGIAINTVESLTQTESQKDQGV
jgi:hypothetical protein